MSEYYYNATSSGSTFTSGVYATSSGSTFTSGVYATSTWPANVDGYYVQQQPAPARPRTSLEWLEDEVERICAEGRTVRAS